MSYNGESDVIRIAAKRGKHKGGKGKKDKRKKGARSLVTVKRRKSEMGVRSGVTKRVKLAGVRRVHRMESRGTVAA